EVQEQVVPEERQRLAVGDELGDVLLDDGQLRVWLGVAIAAPGITRQTVLGGEVRPRGRLPYAALQASHDQRDAAAVAWRTAQLEQMGFQIPEAAIASGVANGVGIDAPGVGGH